MDNFRHYNSFYISIFLFHDHSWSIKNGHQAYRNRTVWGDGRRVMYCVTMFY